MTKYSVSDGHWEEDNPDTPPAWREDTSATSIEIDIQLHDQGYQTDRKWTVHCADRRNGRDLVAGWAVEHRNKGNFWRFGDRWDDAVDFVDLPLRVRRRAAAVLNRDIDDITPDERVIEREDGTGLSNGGDSR
jgi:hypothetical protein